MTHKEWLANEYMLWQATLKEVSLEAAPENPVVVRMLGQLQARIKRMEDYAKKIMGIQQGAINEIGGGIGEFYLTLLQHGYKGEYYIYDLPIVKQFQNKYIDYCKGKPISKQPLTDALLVSFYALGEFDDELKQQYIPVIKSSKHGYIAWNPHSGASDDLSIFDSHKITVTDGVEPGIKIITW